MRARWLPVLFLTAATVSTPLANGKEISPALREKAESLCRDDALRLCAEAIPDEAAIMACMRAKQAGLSQPCRTVLTQALRTMKQ